MDFGGKPCAAVWLPTYLRSRTPISAHSIGGENTHSQHWQTGTNEQQQSADVALSGSGLRWADSNVVTYIMLYIRWDKWGEFYLLNYHRIWVRGNLCAASEWYEHYKKDIFGLWLQFHDHTIIREKRHTSIFYMIWTITAIPNQVSFAHMNNITH